MLFWGPADRVHAAAAADPPPEVAAPAALSAQADTAQANTAPAGLAASLAMPGAAPAEPGASPAIPEAAQAAAAQPAPARCSPESPRYDDLRCYPRRLVIDSVDVLTAPAHWHGRGWTLFSLGIATIGASSLLDKHVQHESQEHRHGAPVTVANIFEPLGAGASFGVLGAFYLGGSLAGDSRAKNVALDGLTASIIASGLITPVLKYAAGRSRPDRNAGTHRFRPFSNNVSFPSGHTTQAFAVASVIATDYDSPWVAVAAYVPAALVGFARIEHNAHFLSDVVGGALIGTAVGRAVALYNRRRRGSHFVVLPYSTAHEHGISVAGSF